MGRGNGKRGPAVTEQSWASRRTTKLVNSTPWLVFSVILLVAVMGGAVYLWLVPAPTAETSQAAPAVTAEASPPSSASAVPAVSICPPVAAVPLNPEQVVLTEIVSTWLPVGTTFRPSSPSGGPAVTEPYAACFTRTPEGALYAAASFVAEASGAVKNSERLPLIESRAARMGNYDKLIASLQGAGETVGQPVSRVSGYRWVEYSPDAAAVELQFRLITDVDGNTAPLSTVFQVAWQENDWKVVIPTEGGGIHLAGDKLRTFTPWGP